MAAVHEALELYETADAFYIQALNAGGETMQIDRLSPGEPRLRLAPPAEIPIDAPHRPIKALLGMLPMGPGGYHLIVATQAQDMGTLNGHRIWNLTGTAVIPFSRSTLALSEAQVTANASLVSLLTAHLSTPGFYFSQTLDLSHSLHRLHHTTPDFLSTPMWQRADGRFLWNSHALRPFEAAAECHRFAMPLLHGFVGMRTVNLPKGHLKVVLISRRSVLRAGTRFWTRGLDAHGHAANFVETEQICEWANRLTSHVQIRGSIPLHWSQRPNLRWQPQPIVDEAQPQTVGFTRHIDQIRARYPTAPLVLVNLVNSSGRERRMADAYQGVVAAAAAPNVIYEYCDFHKDCKLNGWESALETLRKRLARHQTAMDFLATRTDGAHNEEGRSQAGLFRTNCMDSLDRTNVVQALIANTSLRTQLRYLGAVAEKEELESHPGLVRALKHLWADNADACSLQYAGTGALKTDFTRHGIRTTQGKLNDGINAVTRYVKNNFLDGAREDGMAVMTGCWDVGAAERLGDGLAGWRDWHGVAVAGLGIALAMLLLTILLATENAASYAFFWAVVAVAALALIALNGNEFVAKAKLKQD